MNYGILFIKGAQGITCNSEKKKASDKKDDSIIDKLGKLAVLKERGVITDEEFAKFKSKLMSRI